MDMIRFSGAKIKREMQKPKKSFPRRLPHRLSNFQSVVTRDDRFRE